MSQPAPTQPPKLFNSALAGIVSIASSFLLGAFVVHWNADYSTIWTNEVPSVRPSLLYYSHLLSIVPRWYIVSLVGLVGVSVLATVIKLLITGTSGILFDAATLLLLTSGLSVYTTNILGALPYLPLDSPQTASLDSTVTEALRSIASSHMIIAVSLTGILSLQASQSYSERKPSDALEPVRSPPDALPSPLPSLVVVPADGPKAATKGSKKKQ